MCHWGLPKTRPTMQHHVGNVSLQMRIMPGKTSTRSQWLPTRHQQSCKYNAGNPGTLSLIPFNSLPANSGTFNSLSKVLFTFPSWYLYATSLDPITNVRWNLPPTLRSNPKECDSESAHHRWVVTRDKRGSHPHWRSVPKDARMQLPMVELLKYTSQRLPKSQIIFLLSSLFIRHYFGKPILFIILHLLICLN